MTSNDDGRRETREGVGVLGGGTRGALTSYEVGLTFLLLRFAEEAAEERNVTSEGLQRGLEFHESNDDMSLDEVNVEMPKLIGCLLHEWCANEKGCLEKLHDRLRRSARSESAIWEVLISGLRSVNSPDALFDVFRGLESIVCRDFVSPSQLHSSGAFGQMARRLILSFKQASFEAIVKLYDQVQNCLLQFDGRSERRLDGLDEVQEMRSEVQEQQEVKSTVSTAAAHASAAHADSARSLPHIHRHTPTSLSVSMSRLPYAVLKESVRQRTTDFHLVFLDYVNSAQNGFLDSADASLRSFHDKKVLGEDASLPVNAILALANLNLDMRQVDDALQALEDSIRAAQETSDSSCLCACLYLLSFILQITGSDAKGSQSSQQASQAMMHRCLERSEMLGLPLLQCLCCMNIARTLAKDAEKSASREGHGHGSHGSGAAISGATSSRMWGGARGSTGTLGSATQMAGFSGTAQVALAAQAAPLAACSAALLEALQGAPPDPHAQVSTIEAPVSVSGAFAHATMASLLSTCNGDTAFFKTRAKVLLCNAGISDVFGWRALKLNSCKHVMDFYKDSLTAEEHALALQLSDDNEVLEQLRRELPHAGHLWVNSVAKSATGRSLSVRTVPIFQSLVFQTGGAWRAVRHEAAFDAKLSWGRAATDLRLSQGQLLAAYVSVHPCGTGEPPVLCQFFLSLAVIHKKAANPVDAMAAATRAVSVAAHAGLEKEKAEALLMMAQLKLQMQDPLAALHLAEKIETSAFGGHYGEVALLEAEALLDLLSKVCSRNQSTLLEATVERLEVAVKSLESSELSAPAEVRCAAEATQASLAQASTQASQTATARSSTAPRSDGLPQSAACATACALGHYWLARSYHQLKRTTQRDFHAQQFRIQTTGKITTEQRSPYPI